MAQSSPAWPGPPGQRGGGKGPVRIYAPDPRVLSQEHAWHSRCGTNACSRDFLGTPWLAGLTPHPAPFLGTALALALGGADGGPGGSVPPAQWFLRGRGISSSRFFSREGFLRTSSPH